MPLVYHFCFTEESVVKVKYGGIFIQAKLGLYEAILLVHTSPSASSSAL